MVHVNVAMIVLLLKQSVVRFLKVQFLDPCCLTADYVSKLVASLLFEDDTNLFLSKRFLLFFHLFFKRLGLTIILLTVNRCLQLLQFLFLQGRLLVVVCLFNFGLYGFC